MLVKKITRSSLCLMISLHTGQPKGFWPAGSHAIPCGERGGAMQLTSLPGGGGAFPERKKGWTNTRKRCCLELNCGARPHCGHYSA